MAALAKAHGQAIVADEYRAAISAWLSRPSHASLLAPADLVAHRADGKAAA